MVALYNATNGPGWKNSENWLSEAPLDLWHGVSRDCDGSLSRLVLRDNQLGGPIPSELGSLSSLVVLELDENELTGPIPPELGNLSNLIHLDLSHNQLTGQIPPELGNLPNLGLLYLQYNQLTGPIPSWLGSISNFGSLFLVLQRRVMRKHAQVFFFSYGPFIMGDSHSFVASFKIRPRVTL